MGNCVKNFEVTVIQAGFSLNDYLSAEAFREKVERLFASAFEVTPGDSDSSGNFSESKIVVFPELTGLWLPVFMALFAYGKGRPLRFDTLTLKKVFVRALSSYPLKFLFSLIGGKSVRFIFWQRWKEAFHAWIEPFKIAAVRYGVYVCPGSSFLPYIDFDVVMGLSAKGPDIYNTSCLINREGKILGFTRKVNLTTDELRLGIKSGDGCELKGYDTDLGRIGILICLDGFYTGAVEALDRDGCEIIIQPSANSVEWNKPPREGVSISQEEEWLEKGLGALIQGRENILLSVNPMSVSSVLGHTDEGKSNAFVNLSLADKRGFSIEVDRERDREGIDKTRRVDSLRMNRLEEIQKRYRGLSVLASSYNREEIIKFKGVFANGG